MAEAVNLCNQTVSHVVKKTNETVKNSEPEVLEQEEAKIPDYWQILEKIAGNLEEWA